MLASRQLTIFKFSKIHLLTMYIVFGVAVLSVIAPLALSSSCISSCTGVTDGDYQSCYGCNVFVTCSNEITHDKRPCAEADLVWDDNLKRCEYSSSTCPGTSDTTNCKRSCVGVADGDYHSCYGCKVFATCSNGNIHDNRPCPANLVWDDNIKRCEWTSNTCKVSGGDMQTETDDTEQQPATDDEFTDSEKPDTVQRGCISSCTGVTDGDYQSCYGCNVYVTCSNEITHDNRPCAEADLVWDDNLKRCEYSSSTCPGTSDTTNCKRSCVGVADGDYHSCHGCKVYATCSNGNIHDNRPCPANLVWDDNVKRCEWTSNTCKVSGGDMQTETDDTEQQPAIDDAIIDSEEPDTVQRGCISSCTGVTDGDYQSCNGCNVYVTCSNEITHDNRPCAETDLVWDDNLKRCEYSSNTCPGTSDTTNCKRSCAGVADGDYHSCHGCKVYATCSNGIIHDNRPCPANLVWDDNVKRCEWTSNTCKVSGGDMQTETDDTEQQPATDDELTDSEKPDTVQRGCISSCTSVTDGDYQSCNGCNVYVTCSNEITHDNRPCAEADLVWDDNLKRCEYSSNTCPGTSDTTNCKRSCVGVADGDYHSCHGCKVYATCSNGDIYDNRPCPANLVWDDNVKRCEWTSNTCKVSGGDMQTETDDTEQLPATDDKLTDSEEPDTVQRGCISSCTGVTDGDYQSCNGCNVYVTCSNEITHDNRPCAEADLVWDDNLKRCEYSSSTCPGTSDTSNCKRSCEGVADGYYHSCHGCNVYATCSNGNIHDNRPCPANLVWDDNVKRCEWKSNTCKVSGGALKSETDDTEQQNTTDSEESALKKLLTRLITVKRGQTKCVKSCNGVASGDYQSCSGCTVYATCSNGILTDKRPCPAGLYWDDNTKRCEWESDTCGKSQVPAAPLSCDTTISCSSWSFKYAKCSVPGKQIMSASLVKQVSSSICTLGTSYGVKDNGLWVKDGCRGDFTVCACSNIAKIDCDSWGFKYADCPIDGAIAVLDVKLLNQKSSSKCELGESFGIDKGSIWVDKGCRGAFDVCV